MQVGHAGLTKCFVFLLPRAKHWSVNLAANLLQGGFPGRQLLPGEKQRVGHLAERVQVDEPDLALRSRDQDESRWSNLPPTTTTTTTTYQAVSVDVKNNCKQEEKQERKMNYACFQIVFTTSNVSKLIVLKKNRHISPCAYIEAKIYLKNYSSFPQDMTVNLFI